MSKKNRSLHPETAQTSTSTNPVATQPKNPADPFDEIKKLIALNSQATRDSIKELSLKVDKLDDTKSDHEKRIKALEDRLLMSTPQGDPALKAAQPQQNPAPQEAQPQSTSQEKPAAPKADPASQSDPKPQQKPAPSSTADPCALNAAYNGLGKAFRYWDYKSRTYRVVRDIWAAKQAGNGVYDVIWVWYNKGNIDHILSDDEITTYCP